MAKFEKARPDKAALAPIPVPAYDLLGGIEKKPGYVLVLSALMAGAVVTEPKTIGTPRGQVTVDMYTSWRSMDTIQEDVLASCGCYLTRGQVRYAIRRATELGLILAEELVHPETKGVYGKLYSLAPTLFDDSPMVDVSQGYVMFHLGNPSDFVLGDIVIGNYDESSRNPGRPEWMIRQFAEEGFDSPAFASVGRWSVDRHVGDPRAPVYIPRFVLDLDRDELLTAFEDAQEIAGRMEERDYDLDRAWIGFSGRRGLHIEIAASQMGSPIFADAAAAREMAGYVAADISKGIERDPAVEHPRQLIRVAGSVHGETGYRKVMWTAEDFQTLEFQDFLEQIEYAKDNYTPFAYPSESEPGPVDEVAERFAEMAGHASQALYEQARRAKRGGKAASDCILAILEGVGESDNFYGHHCGRSKAAFILACWLAEGKETGDAEVDPDCGMEVAMQAWNTRNSPPMSQSELKGRIKSALRTVGH